MSSRHYTLEELKQKQLRLEERREKLAEKEKRAAARQKALNKQVALKAQQDRDAYLRSLGLLLEAAIPSIHELSPDEITALLTGKKEVMPYDRP